MIYWIWLTLVNGLGPKRQRSLLNKFEDPQAIFNASLKELLECDGIGKTSANNILESRSLEKAMSILEDSNRLGIKLLNLEDELYPKKAKSIEEMPILLYYKGILIKESMGVAIVGARRCTDYGKRVADDCASFLAKENISVISGMAKGIDGYAHTSALRQGGYTIGVLGTPPNPKYFPKRNLIISAWSHKILVIEAGEKSGSLITANYGKVYNKEVLALPDNIFNDESMGTNRLIFDGAKIFLDKKQLLIENKYRYKEKVSGEVFIKNKIESLDILEKTIIDILSKEGSQTTEELSI